MRAYAVVLALLLPACITVQPEPVYPFHAERLRAEGWYRDLHEQVEKCAGKKRPFDALQFLLVRARAMEWGGNEYAGMYSPPYNLYIDERYPMDAPLLAHEFTHYVDEEIGHTDRFWEILNCTLAAIQTEGAIKGK